jgi:hypothetical protein
MSVYRHLSHRIIKTIVLQIENNLLLLVCMWGSCKWLILRLQDRRDTSLHSLVNEQMQESKSLEIKSCQTQENNWHFNIVNLRYLLIGNLLNQKNIKLQNWIFKTFINSRAYSSEFLTFLSFAASFVILVH